MHTIVLYVAIGWLTVLVAVLVVAMVRLPGLLDRVLALDMAGLVLVALLASISFVTSTTHYLNAALALALVAFVGTVAVARYVGRQSATLR